MRPRSPAIDDRACPRCGYDLRGAMARWRESCPLVDRCPECGLEFRWSDLLGREVRLPRWCVEHPRAGRRPVRSALRTLLAAVRPRRFWSELSMEHRMRPARLVVLGLLLVLLLLLIAGARHASFVDEEMTFTARLNPRLTVDRGVALRRAMLLPLSDRPLVARPTAQPLYAPSPRMLLVDAWRSFVLPLSVLLSVPLATALAFAVLPIARRRAKVRWRHVVRITAYAYGACAVVIAFALLIVLARERMVFGAARSIIAAADRLAVLALLPYTLWWWIAAVDRYLRMSRPVAVGLAVWTLGWLGPVAVGGLCWFLLTPETL